MAQKKREAITEPEITGMKYFDRLAPLLERLRDDGCARDKAGNRLLHYDQYCMLVLLYLFNPICSSLRAVQQASELPKVQKRLGCARAALGSLSERLRDDGCARDKAGNRELHYDQYCLLILLEREQKGTGPFMSNMDLSP